MICPHCGSDRTGYMYEYPYPYKIRIKDKLVRLIDKHSCADCEGIFFYEARNGLDMGLDNKMYGQVYTQGHYQYKYTKGI